MNVASMRRVFKRWVDRVTSDAHYDALFEDDANPPAEFSRFGTLPCGYSDDAWLRALDRLNEAARIPVIINGLNASKRPLPSGLLKAASSSNTLGLNYESCYSSTTQPRMPGAIWQSMENSELAVTATGKMFECMARNTTPSLSANAERIYVYASFLLSYDPGTSVLWEQYETPSRFHVEPESQLVALDPLSPSPHDVSGLLTPSGAYARQYRRCYIAGRFAGACAAAVNPDGASHQFPFPGYRRTLVLSGGGILDGGQIAPNGPPPGDLPALSATIAFR